MSSFNNSRIRFKKKEINVYPPPIDSIPAVLDIIETELLDNSAKIIYENYIRVKVKPYATKSYSTMIQKCL